MTQEQHELLGPGSNDYHGLLGLALWCVVILGIVLMIIWVTDWWQRRK